MLEIKDEGNRHPLLAKRLADFFFFFQKLSGWNRNRRLKFAVKAMGKDTR